MISLPTIISPSCGIWPPRRIAPKNSPSPELCFDVESLTLKRSLISSLDNCKKRNFIIANSGSASIYVNAYNNTDTINGTSGTPASITLSPGESVQFFSDGNYNNWIIINGIPPS